MNKPKRIQRKRTKGWRKPEGAVNVARPSKWGNPCNWKTLYDMAIDSVRWADGPITKQERLSEQYDAKETAAMDFEEMLNEGKLPFTEDDIRRELSGKDLMCWCSLNDPCHADVLLKIANQ